MDNKIIVQVDKTVVKITGVQVKGVNIQELEALLRDALGSLVRVIGVTGASIEMDVYGLDADAVRRDEAGIIRAIALAEGITPDDLIKMDSVESIKSVDVTAIPEYRPNTCMMERWLYV